ncbi:hypothetical protein Pst134EA_019746 [Puccinia striiformis f. sp. tritici]|uniref:hypothetical protein n=1 Tax=Puccinia striiformis f. sp. tritici TaxID=168172 RepID=UPI0020079F47|nr:hypothetical protein Pst134EA_019746 [Puccinia striiformis f. sp. tritici]KAH9459606.1 hypothetical protein Pst134EA_019746 [Puccinia striiformis f. sp. tritici]
MRGFPTDKILTVGIILLGLARRNLCILTTENILHTTSEDLQKFRTARDRATRIMIEHREDDSSLLEIGRKISGSPFDNMQREKDMKSKNTLVGIRQDKPTASEAEGPHESLRGFREQMFHWLGECLVDSMDLGLTVRAKDELLGLIRSMMKRTSEISPNKLAEPKHQDHKMRENRGKSGISVTNHEVADKAANRFQDDMRKAWELLTDAKHMSSSSHTLPSNGSIHMKNMMMVSRLSIVFVKLLIASERYELNSSECLFDMVNNSSDKGRSIFNYTLGTFPLKREQNTSIYLSLDFKRSLGESPFTKEIHGILKYLTDQTWQNVAYLHLGSNLKGLEKMSEVFHPLQQRFCLFASPENLQSGPEAHNFCLDKVLKDLLKSVFPSGTGHASTMRMKEEELKFSYDMVHFIINHHRHHVSPEFFNEESILCQQIKAFDIVITHLSRLVKLRYAKYGELLMILALDPLYTERRYRPKVYLTDPIYQGKESHVSHSPPSEKLKDLSLKSTLEGRSEISEEIVHDGFLGSTSTYERLAVLLDSWDRQEYMLKRNFESHPLIEGNSDLSTLMMNSLENVEFRQFLQQVRMQVTPEEKAVYAYLKFIIDRLEDFFEETY